PGARRVGRLDHRAEERPLPLLLAGLAAPLSPLAARRRSPGPAPLRRLAPALRPLAAQQRGGDDAPRGVRPARLESRSPPRPPPLGLARPLRRSRGRGRRRPGSPRPRHPARAAPGRSARRLVPGVLVLPDDLPLAARARPGLPEVVACADAPARRPCGARPGPPGGGRRRG